MKKISRLIAAGSALGLGISLALSSIAFAADLTYSNDVTITLTSPAISMTIEATSAATSVTVNTGTLVATIPSGSSFRVNSTARALLPTGATVSGDVSTSCLSGNKSLVVVTASVTETITFTPSSAACTTSTGGGGGGGGAPPAATAPTASFSGNFSSVVAGTAVTLTWSTTNATSVSINQGVGTVATSGTTSVSPTVTTTYTLTATGTGGTATQAVTITISAANVPAVPPANPPANNPEENPAGTPAPAGAHYNGTLVNDNGTFYLITNGEKIGFRDAAEYLSYGYTFGQAVSANAQDKAMPQSVFVHKAMEGTLVIDAADGKTVYMIGTGSTKRGFVSAAVFKALGYSFAGLPKINLSDYPTGAPIGDANLAHPDGSLVFQGKTIWWIRNGQKTGFESMVVFNTYGFKVAKVLNGNAVDFALPEGTIIKLRDGTLVLDGSTYYLVSDGKKFAFTSMAQLTGLGYKTLNGVKTSLAAYASGGAVQ